jgi:hypothetical protein
LQTGFEAPTLLQQIIELLSMHEVLPLSAVLPPWNGSTLASHYRVQLGGYFCIVYVFVIVELPGDLLFGMSASDLLYLCLFQLIMLES